MEYEIGFLDKIKQFISEQIRQKLESIGQKCVKYTKKPLLKASLTSKFDRFRENEAFYFGIFLIELLFNFHFSCI